MGNFLKIVLGFEETETVFSTSFHFGVRGILIISVHMSSSEVKLTSVNLTKVKFQTAEGFPCKHEMTVVK